MLTFPGQQIKVGRSAAIAAVAFALATPAAAGTWGFTEVSAAAGVAYEHGYGVPPSTEPAMISGGVAAADYDGDGFVDLYAVRGLIGPNLLFRNRGDGTFEEVGAAAGVAITGERSSGPSFADVDGDGLLDLLVGGVQGTLPRLFRNLGGGVFAELPTGFAALGSRNTFSTAFGDPDRDGDLDAFLSHWGAPGPSGHLWLNDGAGSFTDGDAATGIGSAFAASDYSFTPRFTDIDGDGWQDLLLSADFGTSKVFRNLGDGTFVETTGPEITDENGMGSAVGDYDNDGDVDWFVSSIWDPNGTPEGNWGITGNRLYENLGDGTFADVTDLAGVRHGYWGWGSCFADVDNDGHLDLFHVNGIQIAAATEFLFDPARLFVSNGDGTFTERSVELGVADTGQGRGVACFDYDRDGDVDLFIANNSGPSRLFRNDGGNALGHYLTVRLHSASGNSHGIGGRIMITAGGQSQMREIYAGSHFASQSPAEAHFGLGAATEIDELTVRWPDGEVQTLGPLAADQLVTVVQGNGAVAIPTLGTLPLLLLTVLLASAGALALRRRRA